ncbi:MAG: IS200/IS605 family transposase [Pirellulaceae bacterium]|jgi:putative transposase
MGTHHHLLYHIVFSTKNRQRWLVQGFREKVFGYLAGVANQSDGQTLIVNGYLDHVHLLVRIPAKYAVSDFVGKIKSCSSKHLNETSGILRKFGWQDGYGAFTVGATEKDRVIHYIERQEEHHRSIPFESEYLKLLKDNEMEFDPKYLFD